LYRGVQFVRILRHERDAGRGANGFGLIWSNPVESSEIMMAWDDVRKAGWSGGENGNAPNELSLGELRAPYELGVAMRSAGAGNQEWASPGKNIFSAI
jgi:hypothetical protein